MNRVSLLTAIIVACWFSAFFAAVLPAEVTNNAKPLKGNWDFKAQPVWEIESAGDDVLVDAYYIRVDDDGRVFIHDWKYAKFFVFSPEGKFLYSFGKKGEGPGEYKFLSEFYLKGKYVIVEDSSALHYFLKDGKYERTVRLPGNFSIKDFIDEHRFVMVTSTEDEKSKTEKMEIFDTRNSSRVKIAETVAEKSMVASGGGVTVVMKDANTTPLVILTANGGHLYFGKNDKYRITKTDLTGKTLLEFSIEGKKGKEIPMSFKRKRFENVKLNGSKMPEEMIKQMIAGMPDYCTLFGMLHIDESGLIYSYISDLVNKKSQGLDIFSPDGKYLYHAEFKLPEGLKKVVAPVMKGDYFYSFVEDEEGERKLIKFKIAKPTL